MDVFCLQEVFKAHSIEVAEDFLDTPRKVEKILGQGYSYITDNNGLMICYKSHHTIKDHGIIETFCLEGFKKNLLWILISVNNKEYLVATTHGIWVKNNKSDTSERLNQSQIIKSFFDRFDSGKILTGDFNLLPNTESIRILEQNMVNLIKKNSLISTRTRLKTYTDLDMKVAGFADYVFVSLDISVLDFKVLPDEVSDHSSLFLEC